MAYGEESAGGGPAGTGKRLLCVDDERNVLRAVERIFMEEDCEVVVAGSVDEGIEYLKSGQPVQVVISDYRMPGKDGVEFLKEVYKNWPETIRIVLSGYADAAAVVSAINEGHIYKFIPKPWNDDELKVAIHNAFENYFLREKNARLTRELESRNAELESLNESLARYSAENATVLGRVQALLDIMPVAAMGIDPDGVVVLINRHCREMFNSGGVEIGMDRRSALAPEVNAMVERALGGYGNSACATLVNGRKINARGVAVDENGQKGAIIILCEAA